jgi:Na+/proline symporter
MITFSIVLVFVNFMFLFLGASLYIYSTAKGIAIPALTDDLFPTVALKYLGPFAGIVFMVGLISAAYPSADGALTSLTTSFCIDFLGLKKKKNIPEEKLIKIRYLVHFSFAFILLIAVILFKQINDKAVIDKLFVIAGYTYGPLLGLFAFGQLTKLKVHDKFVPAIAVLSPVLCYVISMFSEKWFNGYQLGYELLLLNGFLTFAGLFFVRRNNTGLSA